MKPKLGLIIFYYFLKFFHLIPFSINFKNFDTSPSKKSILWTITFCVAYCFHELFIGDFAHKLRTDLVHSSGIKNKYTAFILLANISLLICLIFNFFKNKLSFNLIKRSKTIFHQINAFGIPWGYEGKIKKFLFKYFVTHLINLAINYTYFFQFSENVSVYLILIYAPLIGLKLFFASAVLMKFDILLVLLKSSFFQINRIIDTKFVKVNSQQSDEMEKLVQIYFNLCKLYEMTIELLSLPLILMVGFHFCVVEAAILLFWSNITNYTETICRSFLNIVWCVFKVRDVYMVFKDGTGILKEVRKKNIIYSVDCLLDKGLSPSHQSTLDEGLCLSPCRRALQYYFLL